jgi:hypothetical protein
MLWSAARSQRWEAAREREVALERGSDWALVQVHRRICRLCHMIRAQNATVCPSPRVPYWVTGSLDEDSEGEDDESDSAHDSEEEEDLTFTVAYCGCHVRHHGFCW